MSDMTHTAIVTGATQGIGKSIAIALVNAGCRVIAVGRAAEKLSALRAELPAADRQLVCEAVDINDGEVFEARLSEWISKWGRISYLVNAAGVLEPGPLLTASRGSIRNVVETNLLATLDVSLTVGRHMASERAGSIVTIGSNSGTVARMGLGAYPASKAGIIHAMKCLGLELAEHGVRCNIVSPGSTSTEMQKRFQSTTGSRDAVLNGDLKTFRLGVPLRKMAEPRDVCELVLFLLSDKAGHITMENIVLDGGATLGAR